jgi:hypothetical protein
MVATFGLTFKIAIASQFVSMVVSDKIHQIPPNYPSIGGIISDAITNGRFDLVIG